MSMLLRKIFVLLGDIASLLILAPLGINWFNSFISADYSSATAYGVGFCIVFVITLLFNAVLIYGDFDGQSK